ncbi:MAG: methyltransferase domain-containing protein [Proteobacteria bacterium]|nr:methyltransferase domain-containing protein [Pseudomonadota bacterium]
MANAVPKKQKSVSSKSSKKPENKAKNTSSKKPKDTFATENKKRNQGNVSKRASTPNVAVKGKVQAPSSIEPPIRKFLDPATKSWIAAVNHFGKRPKGQTISKPTEQVKSIFLSNKKQVLELWETYTQHRLAYLLGFHLPNIARAMELFTRSNKRHLWNKLCSKNPVRVFDIGCGTGAMSAAFLQAAKATEVNLYDGSGPLLDIAKQIHTELKTPNLRTSRKNIEDLEPQWFKSENPETVHVYLLGYVWNELERNNPARRRLMNIITSHVERNEKCLLFIAEPALEAMSRPTMELRDILCLAGFQALYPCPTSAGCPMLERPKDWCYTEGLWDQPDIARWIDLKLELDRQRHASTTFMFASPACKIESDGKPIVVGRPTKEEGIERYKGFYDYLICSKTGLEKQAPTKPKSVILKGDLYSS